jgi:transcriptional regulator of arginine metabolism
MSDSPEKFRRHRAIRRLLHDEPVATQQELARHLRQAGFPTTQATLSRDLKELRIHRVSDGANYRWQEAGADGPEAHVADAETRRLQSVAALEVTGIDANEHCVIVRTLTGRAQGVAVWLDGLGLDDLLATIAGDDTILVVPRSIQRTARLKTELAGAFGL